MQEEKKFFEEKECFKCGSKKNLKEDPNIEGLFFVLTAGKKEKGRK
jgi:hypothetical protein